MTTRSLKRTVDYPVSQDESPEAKRSRSSGSDADADPVWFLVGCVVGGEEMDDSVIDVDGDVRLPDEFSSKEEAEVDVEGEEAVVDPVLDDEAEEASHDGEDASDDDDSRGEADEADRLARRRPVSSRPLPALPTKIYVWHTATASAKAVRLFEKEFLALLRFATANRQPAAIAATLAWCAGGDERHGLERHEKAMVPKALQQLRRDELGRWSRWSGLDGPLATDGARLSFWPAQFL
jgi:hypothetical protein